MLYLPNEYSPGVQAENLRVQDGRIALGHEVSTLTAASPRPATTQGCRNALRNGDQGQCREAANQTASTR